MAVYMVTAVRFFSDLNLPYVFMDDENHTIYIVVSLLGRDKHICIQKHDEFLFIYDCLHQQTYILSI